MTKALREMHGKYIGNRPVKASPPHHSSPPRHRRASTPRPFRCARAPGPSAARSSQAPNSSGCTRWQSTTRRSGANSRRPRASSGRTCTRGRRTCPGDCDRRRAPRSVWGERVAESRLQRVQRSALCSLPGSPATSTTGRRAHAPRPPHAPRSRSALAPQRSSAHDCVGAAAGVVGAPTNAKTPHTGSWHPLFTVFLPRCSSQKSRSCDVPRTTYVVARRAGRCAAVWFGPRAGLPSRRPQQYSKLSRASARTASVASRAHASNRSGDTPARRAP